MFSIYGKNGKFLPGNWVTEMGSFTDKELEKMKNSKSVQKKLNQVPLEDKINYDIRDIVKENWQLLVIGFIALLVLIKD